MNHNKVLIQTHLTPASQNQRSTVKRENRCRYFLKNYGANPSCHFELSHQLYYCVLWTKLRNTSTFCQIISFDKKWVFLAIQRNPFTCNEYSETRKNTANQSFVSHFFPYKFIYWWNGQCFPLLMQWCKTIINNTIG